MTSIIQSFLLCCFLIPIGMGRAQQAETVKLHLQLYNQGICIPMSVSSSYNAYPNQKNKTVFSCGSYYSTITISINSKDTADITPLANHKLQSASLQLHTESTYELTITRSNGFNRNEPEIMQIQISKLNSDAQLLIPFKKGSYELEKMKYFKKLRKNAIPDFLNINKEIKNELKLDSTAYFSNGKVKAKYYSLYDNFPLKYIREFDSINSENYAQGFRLMIQTHSLYKANNKPVWGNTDAAKYNYWEYIENGVRVKHEFWAGTIKEQFEWYPSGQLKAENYYDRGHYNPYYNSQSRILNHALYLENGNKKQEFYTNLSTRSTFLENYSYSSEGKLVLLSTYSSSNGVTLQELQKRVLFYPSGQIKMEENFLGTYTITYYNEDGSQKY